MKKLLNTLYVISPESYLSLDGENIVVLRDDQETKRVPLHNLESVVAFNRTGASPALMAACAQRNVQLQFMTPNGRFLARVTGGVCGNVLLRKEQYRISDDEKRALPIARNIICGKIYNARWVLKRALRDHPMRVDEVRLTAASNALAHALDAVQSCASPDSLRGLEGEAATHYFGVLNELILQQKEDFVFATRNRRPPLDRVNAMLSFLYTLLAGDVAAALEGVGLDPYVGFLHTDRSGRPSLALDLMEELRAPLADRLAISLINKNVVNKKGFVRQEGGAIHMRDDTRAAVISAWQERKRETIQHPFLEEKIPWGLVPHAQALLLARHIRGDLDAYPAFLWK